MANTKVLLPIPHLNQHHFILPIHPHRTSTPDPSLPLLHLLTPLYPSSPYIPSTPLPFLPSLGTQFDLTQGTGGGPFGDPMRWPTLQKWEDKVEGISPEAEKSGLSFQRPISLWRTAYSTVTQVGGPTHTLSSHLLNTYPLTLSTQSLNPPSQPTF